MVSGGAGDGSGKSGAGGEGGKSAGSGEGGKTGAGGKGDGLGKGTGVAVDHAGMVAGSNCSNDSTAALALPIELAKNLRCSRCCCLKTKLRRPYTVITTPSKRPATKLTTLCENIFSPPSPGNGTVKGFQRDLYFWEFWQKRKPE